MNWYKKSNIQPIKPVAPIQKKLPRKLPIKKKPVTPKKVAPNHNFAPGKLDIKA